MYVCMYVYIGIGLAMVAVRVDPDHAGLHVPGAQGAAQGLRGQGRVDARQER